MLPLVVLGEYCLIHMGESTDPTLALMHRTSRAMIKNGEFLGRLRSQKSSFGPVEAIFQIMSGLALLGKAADKSLSVSLFRHCRMEA